MYKSTGDPAPLGLFGFGMTTVLLNLHNAGHLQMSSIIIGCGIFVGGIAQVIAGYQEWTKGNTFGATAFTAFGMFWLTFVAILIIPQTSFGASFKTDAESLGVFLFLWGLFTLYMFVATIKLNKMLQVVFLSLTVLFFLLGINEFIDSKILGKFAGYEGLFCGLSAIYGSAAIVLKGVYGKAILPLGERKKD